MEVLAKAAVQRLGRVEVPGNRMEWLRREGEEHREGSGDTPSLGEEAINESGQTLDAVLLKPDELHSRSVHHKSLAIRAADEVARIGSSRSRPHLDLMSLDRDGETVEIADPDGNGVFDQGARDADIQELGFAELKEDGGLFRHAHP